MEVNINGFHQGFATIGRIGCSPNRYRQADENGSFHTKHEGHERAAVPRNFHKGNIQSQWVTTRYYHGSRFDIHIGPMERNHEETGDRKKAEHGLSPPNGRPNGIDKFHVGTISPSLRQLPAGRLEGAPTNGRIRLQ